MPLPVPCHLKLLEARVNSVKVRRIDNVIFWMFVFIKEIIITGKDRPSDKWRVTIILPLQICCFLESLRVSWVSMLLFDAYCADCLTFFAEALFHKIQQKLKGRLNVQKIRPHSRNSAMAPLRIVVWAQCFLKVL